LFELANEQGIYFKMEHWTDNEEIRIFREYLQIPSVHPNVDYVPCVEFLLKQADDLHLPLSIYYPSNKLNPVVVITWQGYEPELPTIMLNSHMDVVPVFEEEWKYKPFGAEIDSDGRIYARGSQDTKCLGTQYLAAIRALKNEGINQLKRTVHVTFVPDEEVGGELGMKSFVKSEAFKKLNVGFELDEAAASTTDELFLFNAERTMYAIELTCKGQSGHGSSPLPNTPGEKVRHILDKFMDFRSEEISKITSIATTGDVTNVNLTMINGGVQKNVIPAEIKLVFDIRLAVDVDFDDFESQINRWCEEAGGDITIRHIQIDPKAPVTQTDETNPFWMAFKKAADELNLSLIIGVCPGTTDARYIRQSNIPAFGFTPIRNTPLRLHDHNEFIFADGYLDGIKIYKNIITKIANV